MIIRTVSLAGAVIMTMLVLGPPWQSSVVPVADAAFGPTKCNLRGAELGPNFTRICEYTCGGYFAVLTTDIPGSCPSTLEL